jgi:PIN domain nuclease of toxin-antitoxin system
LKLLLDTHVVIWMLTDDRRLSAVAHRLVEDESHPCFLSVACVWEIAIKRSIDRLAAPADFPAEFHHQMARRGIPSLPIYDRHAAAVADLPLHHRDPFDRLLVAQAQVEGLTILSADELLRAYDVPILW